MEVDGVHVGQTDMPCLQARRLLGPEKVIGVTVHNLAEAVQAEGEGADYLGVSPIFQTATKPDAGKPAGISLIEEIRDQVDIPLVAIGGINQSNAADCIHHGADGVAVVSAICGAEDPKAAAAAIKKAVNDALSI